MEPVPAELYDPAAKPAYLTWKEWLRPRWARKPETEAELAECMKDQLWRLNNLYQGVTEEGDPFLFTMKEGMFRWYMEDRPHRRSVILKARQYGFTTFICLYYLDEAIFLENQRVVIIAHHIDDAKIIFRDKVRHPYDKLPEALKAQVGARSDRTDELLLGNNSAIRVTTSARSGTVTHLLVSEYGKVSAKFPEKAREIKTGSFPAAEHGQITVESTAEGRTGQFFNLCDREIKRVQRALPPTGKDFSFFFHPWWADPTRRMSVAVPIPRELQDYFAELAELGIELSQEQKWWYAATFNDLGEDMLREHPSTPEEAFKASVEGAYYAKQMAHLRRSKAITRVPWMPNVQVDTFWDLGINDQTAIAFAQFVGGIYRFIDYIEDSGEGLQHYAKILQERPYLYGRHYLPHDADHRIQGATVERRSDILPTLGVRPTEVVDRIQDELDGIEAVRALLPICVFDEENCDRLITCLDSYRKEWDDKLGTWKDRPVHDEYSHGAKTLELCAVGHRQAPVSKRERRRKRPDWRTV